MLGFLKPSPTLSEGDVQRTLRLMRWDNVAAAALFSLGSGGFMAAYALALGANNLQVGILAALPPMSQVVSTAGHSGYRAFQSPQGHWVARPGFCLSLCGSPSGLCPSCWILPALRRWRR